MLAAVAGLALAAGAFAASARPAWLAAEEPAREVQLESKNGNLLVPVIVNDAALLKFTLDSGATDVTLSIDVFLDLVRTGVITESDFTGFANYMLADGRKIRQLTFRLKSLRLGGVTVHDVRGSVADVRGVLLLGQTFLSRFTVWSVDNQRRVLILHSNASPPERAPLLPWASRSTRQSASASAPPSGTDVGALAGATPSASSSSAAVPHVVCADTTTETLRTGMSACQAHGGPVAVR